MSDAISTGTGVISHQVVQEVLNVLTSRFPGSAASDEADRLLREVLEPLWRIQPSIALYRSALNLKARYQLHFYDALIVAAAIESGCERLISEDFQHGQRFESVTVHNPFL